MVVTHELSYSNASSLPINHHFLGLVTLSCQLFPVNCYLFSFALILSLDKIYNATNQSAIQEGETHGQ